MKSKNGNYDPLVVLTEELSRVLNRWIYEFRAEHPFISGRSHKKLNNGSYEDTTWFGEYRRNNVSEDMPTIGAIDWLSTRIDRNPRVIQRIINCESKTTSLFLADAILQAIERPDATHNGEIMVIPNPQWSNERYQQWQASEGRSCDP